jgi:hypothetical protein
MAARNSQSLASCSSAMLKALRYSSSAASACPCRSQRQPQHDFAPRRLDFVSAPAAVLLVVGASVLLVPAIQARVQHLFPTDDKLQGLRTLFVTVGGALLGATVIVSSLVLFSMQVNADRMPHGLFRRLSGDRRLLGMGCFEGSAAIGGCLVRLPEPTSSRSFSPYCPMRPDQAETLRTGYCLGSPFDREPRENVLNL